MKTESFQNVRGLFFNLILGELIMENQHIPGPSFIATFNIRSLFHNTFQEIEYDHVGTFFLDIMLPDLFAPLLKLLVNFS